MKALPLIIVTLLTLTSCDKQSMELLMSEVIQQDDRISQESVPTAHAYAANTKSQPAEPPLTCTYPEYSEEQILTEQLQMQAQANYSCQEIAFTRYFCQANQPIVVRIEVFPEGPCH